MFDLEQFAADCRVALREKAATPPCAKLWHARLRIPG